MADERSELIKRTKEDFRELVSNLGDIPPETIPLMEEAFVKLSTENLSLAEAMGVTPDILEVIYQHGYHFFQSGKYDDALLVFNLLRQLNPKEMRYIFSIAACQHHKKNYIEAAVNYMLYAASDLQNPIPYFHLYDCFSKTGHPDLAQNALKEALRLAKLNPKYEKLKEKAQLELNFINESLV